MEVKRTVRMAITILEAKDLEDVRIFFQMKPYAKVSVNSDPKSKQKTQIDKHGKTNPSWSFPMSFTVAESELQQHGPMLVIKLYTSRKAGDRYIGEVHASIKELFEQASANGGSVLLTKRVKRGAAESKGELTFSCTFGDRITTDTEAQPSSSEDEEAADGRWKLFRGGAFLAGTGLKIADILVDL